MCASYHSLDLVVGMAVAHFQVTEKFCCVSHFCWHHLMACFADHLNACFITYEISILGTDITFSGPILMPVISNAMRPIIKTCGRYSVAVNVKTFVPKFTAIQTSTQMCL